jgi:Domain of unknown function (DUF4286)
MILYNVTVSLDPSIHEDWLAWMQGTHIPEILATALFSEYRLVRILNEEEGGVTYSTQYFCADLETFERYKTQFAPKLQAAMQQRYNGRYAAFRTLLEVVSEGKYFGNAIHN